MIKRLKRLLTKDKPTPEHTPEIYSMIVGRGLGKSTWVREMADHYGKALIVVPTNLMKRDMERELGVSEHTVIVGTFNAVVGIHLNGYNVVIVDDCTAIPQHVLARLFSFARAANKLFIQAGTPMEYLVTKDTTWLKIHNQADRKMQRVQTDVPNEVKDVDLWVASKGQDGYK